MIKLKNKALLTLGSLATTIAPISAIISCSPGSNMGQAESKFLAALKSSDGVRKINNIWLDKALKQLYENGTNTITDIQTDLKKYIEFFIAEELRKNNKYLTDLSNTWALELSDSNSRTKRDKLTTDFAMGQYYKTFAEWNAEFTNSKTFDDFIEEYLFNTNDPLGEDHQISVKTDFLVNIKEALIVKKYLQTKKEAWMKVFGKEDDEKLYDTGLDSNQDVWNMIDDDEFPLILEGMRKHYAYSWNIQIKDETEVLKLLQKVRTGNQPSGTTWNPGEETANEMAKQFTPTGALGKLSNYTQEQQKAINDYSVLNIVGDLANYVGYQGIKALPDGQGKLDFTWNYKSNWEDKNSPTEFDGFIAQSKLKRGNEVVKYAEQSAKEINLTLWNGNYLIPTYNSTDEKIKFDSALNGNKKENLYWTFINQNKSLYEKAVQYYTNKEDPIQLDASEDKFLEKQLKDMGIKFLKED